MMRPPSRTWASAALSLVVCALAHAALAQDAEAPPPAAPAPAPEVQPSQSDELQRVLERANQLEQRVQQLEQAQVESALAANTEVNPALLAAPETFRIYGFADFGVNHAWVGENSLLRGLASTATTFAVGNLNLYFHFQPDAAWQVLAEIRFTGYPHGEETAFATPLGGEYARTDTQVIDVGSPATSFQFRWGGIFIERAYAQYTFSEHLSIKVGQFLTPYGIWNVDHGTPTLIALMMPHFVSAEIFPARQVGIALSGALMMSGWELGYDAYVSNGRTATQLDFTSNKAFGGRLKLGRVAPLPIVLGVSFYYGQLDDIEKEIVSFDPFRIQRNFIVEGTEAGVGADFAVDVDALRIRSEAIMRAVRYEDGKRLPITIGPPGSLKPDNNEYDAYLLAAYRLPVWGLEPFAYGEFDHFVSPLGDDQLVIAGGLNIHFTEFAQLKTEVARVLFFDMNAEGSFSENNMTLLFSRLAVAF